MLADYYGKINLSLKKAYDGCKVSVVAGSSGRDFHSEGKISRSRAGALTSHVACGGICPWVITLRLDFATFYVDKTVFAQELRH